MIEVSGEEKMVPKPETEEYVFVSL